MSDKPSLLEDLRSKRDTIMADWNKLIDEREAALTALEAREETTEDDTKADEAAELDFRAASEDLEGQIAALDERISTQEKKAERLKNAERSAISGVESVKEPLVYREDNQNEHSYMVDICSTDPKLAQAMITDARAARERIVRHGKQMEEVIPQREEQRAREAEAQMEQAEREFRSSFKGRVSQRELVSPFEKRVSPSRAPGQGGEFIPPLWEVDQYSPYLRAGRVVAPICRNIPLPPGTDVIKVPRVKLGTEVGPQVADNAGVVSRDLETEYIEAPIKTIAGQQDVALQAIEMSPNQIFGRMVQEDLQAAWNREVDREVIYGKGTNYSTLNAGTIKGLLPATNWGKSAAVNIHESGEAVSGQVILAGLGANRSWIAQNRFTTEGVHHVLHSKRAEYLINTYDGGTAGQPTGRRLNEPTDFPQYNVSGQPTNGQPAEGLVLALPSNANVYSSTNIPTTFNKAGTVIEAAAGYDVGLTAKFDDVWFFESDARMRVLSEVLSGTLTVRYQIYSYVGMLVRFESSVMACSGKPFEKEPTLGGFKYGE